MEAAQHRPHPAGPRPQRDGQRERPQRDGQPRQQRERREQKPRNEQPAKAEWFDKYLSFYHSTMTFFLLLTQTL